MFNRHESNCQKPQTTWLQNVIFPKTFWRRIYTKTTIEQNAKQNRSSIGQPYTRQRKVGAKTKKKNIPSFQTKEAGSLSGATIITNPPTLLSLLILLMAEPPMEIGANPKTDKRFRESPKALLLTSLRQTQKQNHLHHSSSLQHQWRERGRWVCWQPCARERLSLWLWTPTGPKEPWKLSSGLSSMSFVHETSSLFWEFSMINWPRRTLAFHLSCSWTLSHLVYVGLNLQTRLCLISLFVTLLIFVLSCLR